jgi:hypothetical protein
MKLSASNKVIVAMVGFAALALFFWVLVLSPKRQEADKLGTQAEALKSSLATHEAEVEQALEARAGFSGDYRQLVVLGKAVPRDDETASLLVQLNRIAKAADVKFRNLKLASDGGGEEVAAPPLEGVSPTEAAAATLPLGATVGPAGLAVMPYELTFDGTFFDIADFIHGLDAMVQTENAKVSVTGRLITIGGFSLKGDSGIGFPALEGSFTVTTYLTPPEQGATGGLSPAGPEIAEPVSATVGVAP